MKRATLLQGTFTVLGTLACCLVLGTAWRLDAQAGPTVHRSAEQLNGALTEAQHASTAYERALRKAQAECRAERGPDALTWKTPEGFMVCRRRSNTGGTV